LEKVDVISECRYGVLGRLGGQTSESKEMMPPKKLEETNRCFFLLHGGVAFVDVMATVEFYFDVGQPHSAQHHPSNTNYPI
jgi:hypothetical protein